MNRWPFSDLGFYLPALLLTAFAFPAAARSGAPAGELWSLQPVVRPNTPGVRQASWVRNAIDPFILARLEKAGLAPSDEADRRTLIRRLSFDLTGLPPTPAQVESFMGDERPDAYERLVDRLLGSPRYGERWGRHWLDVVRYTESHGYERDQGRYSAWPYRDYVIGAFNSDKPYDQFVRQQLAGDVLDPVTKEGVVAASFLVAGPWDQVGSDQQSEVGRAHIREEELEGLLGTVAQTFLGLTLDCARCHDHRNDPIPQADYYRFKAAFDGVWHGERPVGTPDQVARYERHVPELQSRILKLERDLKEFETAPEAEAPESEQQAERRRQQLRSRLAEARAELEELPQLLVAYVGRREQPGPTHVLRRGDPTSLGEPVVAAGLSAIGHPSPDLGLDADSPEADRRLRLADWIVHPEHPLTARVMVNRVWHYHFGSGLVATPNDFGGLGEPPSHPELLDFLAGWFIEQGWSVKALHRLIVTSATYRQASAHRAEPAELDAENRLLWRFTPRRLEAEAIRDAQLFWSGQLNGQMGGESFQPFELYVRSGHYYLLEDRAEPQYNRRTVYRMNVISGKDPLLDAFDCPDPGARTPQRRTTITPQQALGLMNNSFVQRQSVRMADRLLDESKGEAVEAIDRAYRHVLGRPPTQEELERAAVLVAEHGLAQLTWVLFNASEALYVR